MGRKINEERGARRAAELKKRFSRVSNRAFGNSRLMQADFSSPSGRPRSFLSMALIWLGIGFAAFLLFSVFAG